MGTACVHSTASNFVAPQTNCEMDLKGGDCNGIRQPMIAPVTRDDVSRPSIPLPATDTAYPPFGIAISQFAAPADIPLPVTPILRQSVASNNHGAVSTIRSGNALALIPVVDSLTRTRQQRGAVSTRNTTPLTGGPLLSAVDHSHASSFLRGYSGTSEHNTDGISGGGAGNSYRVRVAMFTNFISQIADDAVLGEGSAGSALTVAGSLSQTSEARTRTQSHGMMSFVSSIGQSDRGLLDAADMTPSVPPLGQPQDTGHQIVPGTESTEVLAERRYSSNATRNVRKFRPRQPVVLLPETGEMSPDEAARLVELPDGSLWANGRAVQLGGGAVPRQEFFANDNEWVPSAPQCTFSQASTTTELSHHHRSESASLCRFCRHQSVDGRLPVDFQLDCDGPHVTLQ